MVYSLVKNQSDRRMCTVLFVHDMARRYNQIPFRFYYLLHPVWSGGGGRKNDRNNNNNECELPKYSCGRDAYEVFAYNGSLALGGVRVFVCGIHCIHVVRVFQLFYFGFSKACVHFNVDGHDFMSANRTIK